MKYSCDVSTCLQVLLLRHSSPGLRSLQVKGGKLVALSQILFAYFEKSCTFDTDQLEVPRHN